MKNPNLFKDKIAFVTGGGEGLGRALCIKLAECNATVICTDKDLQLAEKTVEMIKSQTGNETAMALNMDVSNFVQISAVIAEVYSSYGKIDYLFNNAGIAIGGEIRDLSVDHWQKVIDVNLMGLIHCSSEVFKRMSEVKQGHIVNITSISGLLEYTALSTPYAVSKHGAVTFSKALRLEAMDFNVNVTTVCPGTIKTQICKNMVHINANENASKRTVDFIEKGISPEAASEIILNGVANNKKLIVFPGSFKVFYFVSKIFGSLVKNMSLKMLREFREKDRLS